MRPILPPDLDLLVRVVLPLPAATRAGVMVQILTAADLADRYRKRTGRLHPVYGDGSVLSVALQRGPTPPRSYCDTGYCAAMVTVLTSIADWRTGRRTLRIL